MNRRTFLTTSLISYQWGADWDIPTMIANCTKVKALGGVELNIDAGARAEVKRMFSGSAVKLVGINSAERFDWPDPAALRTAIENAKAHAKLAHDTGATGIRVFPNQFHKDVSQAKTLENTPPIIARRCAWKIMGRWKRMRWYGGSEFRDAWDLGELDREFSHPV